MAYTAEELAQQRAEQHAIVEERYKDLKAELAELKPGDRVKFWPGPRQNIWWHILERDENHIVAVRQQAFAPMGDYEYTVTGWRDYPYNGEGPGPVRSSLNSLGGGWDAVNDSVIEALASGHWELSNRRLISIRKILKK